MEISLDKATIDDYMNFIQSETFAKFLIDNTTDFLLPLVILQTLLDKGREMESAIEED